MKKYWNNILVSIFCLAFLLGCEKEGIKEGENVAIAIKPDGGLESVAKECMVIASEELKRSNCPLVMAEIVNYESLAIAETQPNSELYNRMVDRGAEKFLIGRLRREDGTKITLEINIISKETRKSIASFSRELPTISPEAFRSNIYKIIRENLIEKHKEKESQ